jgi:hypothetical protein
MASASPKKSLFCHSHSRSRFSYSRSPAKGALSNVRASISDFRAEEWAGGGIVEASGSRSSLGPRDGLCSCSCLSRRPAVGETSFNQILALMKDSICWCGRKLRVTCWLKSLARCSVLRLQSTPHAYAYRQHVLAGWPHESDGQTVHGSKNGYAIELCLLFALVISFFCRYGSGD